MRLFRVIRFWAIPLVSLIATFCFPIDSWFLWLLWAVAFLGVCEGGTSTASVLRPAVWVGIHSLPIVIQLIR